MKRKLVQISLFAAMVLALAGCPPAIGNGGDALAVAEALDVLTAEDFVFSGTDTASGVTTDFQVPTTAEVDGVALSWASSEPARAEVNATGTVAVRRAFIGGDATATLTVTASKGTTSASKDFSVTVLAKPGISESVPILKASDAQAFDDFGLSVSVSGDFAVAGAPDEDTGGVAAGAAYVFESNGSTWSEAAILRASNGGDDDEFGRSVAVDGDYVIVGAPSDDGDLDAGPLDAGAAYVFERTDSGWTEADVLRASDAAIGDQFGSSVAISGNYAIVGAPKEDGGSSDVSAAGAAYVFRRTASGWIEDAILRAADLQAGAELGFSVGISGSYAIAGAPYRDIGGFSEGAAYVFERDESGWNQQPVVEASDAQENDQFGYSVAISTTNAIVGAHSEDGGAGDPTSSAGAAYAFSRGATGWSEIDVLRASDAAEASYFGRAVSVYGDYALVGAHGPGSFAGAAYLFSLEASSWSEESILGASDAGPDDVFGWSVGISEDRAIIGAPENEEGAAYVFE